MSQEFIALIEDRKSYEPEAWGPFPDANLAADHVLTKLDPQPLEENVRIIPLHRALEDER